MHNPLYVKESKNQLSQHASFQTMKENKISHLFFCFAQTASIRHPPTPLFEPILSQKFCPRCFPSKKISSCRSPGVPNYTIRERLRSPTCRGVKRLNWKVIILCLQPHHTIIITQRDGIIMQPPKKDISFLQLSDI